MGKRKADDELERFVWKRNIEYDLQLLTEIEQLNPYASTQQGPAWKEIADRLLKHPLAMKVTARSCRERTAELLKTHRRNERTSIQTSGVGNERETALQTLLTSVSKLEVAKPSKVVSSLFSTKDLAEAEAIRNKALNDTDSESEKEALNDDFEFGPDKKGSGKKPKSDVVKYLEAKRNGELSMRKEELRVREEELKIKKEEIKVQRIRAETEAEQSKAMMNLLMKLVNPSAKE